MANYFLTPMAAAAAVLVVMVLLEAATGSAVNHLQYTPLPDLWQKDVSQHSTVSNMTAAGESATMECSHYCTEKDDRFG